MPTVSAIVWSLFKTKVTMRKFLAIIIIAVFSLNTFANGTLTPDYTPTPKAKVTKVKRTTLKRIVKYRIQHQDNNVILVDSLPVYGRNRNYYIWNRLVVDPVSDEIKLRLALVRIKALNAYHSKWS
jgi:archaellum biogenesis ATPase FlaH